ncbi:putative sulfate transport protein CysZ (plasmid) [Legionella adelaidensis]|uniref:Putative sulfate transport protein CysZ n=1 Tax=Legionella adelaidensis TaxID=45056 RepID=A0A0W0R249_9GAMM|nr:sulfate transporter CysZ [Legionella adelaidensis]KTC65158.1 putative sulfate transport protein CysZ [Legionella adelaidensis]VEH85050.1 putative sulfate transport protein CysZ [Legionella adelaidensis]
MGDFFQGAGYLFRGAKHLLTPGLKRFVVLPILFNFLLFTGLFFLLYHYLFPFADYYIKQLPAWLSFLHGFLVVVLFISTFLLFLSMFTVLFNIVAAPFNGLLAERAQLALFKSEIPSLSFMQITLRSIKRQMQFLGYFFPRFIALLLLFFVPFIQPVYPFIWFFFNAWMLSVQYQDFAMDNNLNSFGEMQEKIKQYKLLSLGFGSIINLASFIPVLNLFTMPAAVIGSVILFCEQNKRSHTC